jgi:hypothetical protein
MRSDFQWQWCHDVELRGEDGRALSCRFNSDAKFKVPFKVYGGGTGTWNWSATYDINNEKQKVCLEFDAGVHTMAIHGRSRDHAIDKVALFLVQRGRGLEP